MKIEPIERPANPFREGTLAQMVMEMAIQEEFDGLSGTSDLTLRELGDLLIPAGDRKTDQIRNAISRIKRKTGYKVKCADERKQRYGYK